MLSGDDMAKVGMGLWKILQCTLERPNGRAGHVITQFKKDSTFDTFGMDELKAKMRQSEENYMRRSENEILNQKMIDETKMDLNNILEMEERETNQIQVERMEKDQNGNIDIMVKNESIGLEENKVKKEDKVKNTVVISNDKIVNQKEKSNPKVDSMAFQANQISSLQVKGKPRKVPSSPISRLTGFAGMFGQIAINTAAGFITGADSLRSAATTEKNAEIVAQTLCRMRGAALKLGQMLSIQDTNMLPKEILEAFERVRQNADYMPERQLRKMMADQLGNDWQGRFEEFEFIPIAAASIGQVHRGKLRCGTPVAVKVQYPGVAQSIDSDILNLQRLLKITSALPKGAFLDSTIEQARFELSQECDYRIEAKNQEDFKDLIENDPKFQEHVGVPKVFREHSTDKILTTELVEDAVTLSDLVADSDSLTQYEKEFIPRVLLNLNLSELFLYRRMQTDPNWANFLYSRNQQKVYLIDFGACTHFPIEFTSNYLQLVYGASTRQRDFVIEKSIELGFLTGEESDVMLDAHVNASTIIGAPFSPEYRNQIFDFEKQEMTTRIQHELPVMLRHRLTPPPKLSYSLHRKLSGSFLLCCKLGAQMDSAGLFYDTLEEYWKNCEKVELPNYPFDRL